MYEDFYLKFADEAEADDVLYTVHPEVVEDGTVTVEAYTTPNYANIDVLGILYEEQVDHDADPVPLPGWHVNVRLVFGEDAAALEPFKVEPKQPRRVWA